LGAPPVEVLNRNDSAGHGIHPPSFHRGPGTDLAAQAAAPTSPFFSGFKGMAAESRAFRP